VNSLKNNFISLIEVKKNRWVLYGWFVIEILQKTNYAVNFFVMHMSSFFGAIVLLILIDFYKKSKWLKTAPIFIEIIHSLYFQGVVDMGDVIFSLLGIIAYTVVFKSKKIKIRNKNE
jgi:hypothetical protein